MSDAPEPLKTLLGRHLDLARLAALRGEAVADLQRLIAAAPGQVRELARTEGYFEPVVELRREPGTPPRVHLSVVPGPRVTVDEVDLRVEGELEQRAAASQAEARRLLARVGSAAMLRAGSPFRKADWSDAKLKWLTTLRAGGYAAAALRSSQATVDVASASARLVVVVDSGPLFVAGALRVEGLARHEESTVRDVAGMSAGKPLTERELVDLQNRLIKTGLYSSVAVSYDTAPEQAGASTLTVRVAEQPLQQATVGLGFSTDTGPCASLEHTHRRLLGQPLVAQNKIEWGTVA